MNTCDTCHYWAPYERKYPGGIPTDDRKPGGICECPKLSEDGPRELDALVYSYQEGGDFWTGPKFGCIQHAPSAPGRAPGTFLNAGDCGLVTDVLNAWLTHGTPNAATVVYLCGLRDKLARAAAGPTITVDLPGAS